MAKNICLSSVLEGSKGQGDGETGDQNTEFQNYVGVILQEK